MKKEIYWKIHGEMNSIVLDNLVFKYVKLIDAYQCKSLDNNDLIVYDVDFKTYNLKLERIK